MIIRGNHRFLAFLFFEAVVIALCLRSIVTESDSTGQWWSGAVLVLSALAVLFGARAHRAGRF